MVIICGVLYPNATATGICMQRYAEMISDDYDIDIICIASNMEVATVNLREGIRIHALAGGTQWYEASAKGIMKRLAHLNGQIQMKLRFLGNLKWFSEAAFNKLNEIDKKKKIDVVFSVCSPMAAHYAALKYKETNPLVRWVAYTVDFFATPERIRPIGYSLEKLAELEQCVLRKADAVLLSEEIYNNHPDIVSSLVNVEKLPYVLPFQEVSEAREGLFEKDTVNCVFAGSFYPKLRDPEIMLDTFSRIQDSRIRLHLFSSGCDEIVERYGSRCRAIVPHGRVSSNEIQKVYYEADVLINIGNTNTDFIPSKTYEYIASGKPIVNFYHGAEPDHVLKRYPLAFHISNEVKQDEVQDVEDFLNETFGNRVSKEEIERLYPSNTACYIKRLLKLNLIEVRRTIGNHCNI